MGADGRNLAVVLEERERHLPILAGLLIHGGNIAQADRPR
jgi:hypothetical protein